MSSLLFRSRNWKISLLLFFRCAGLPINVIVYRRHLSVSSNTIPCQTVFMTQKNTFFMWLAPLINRHRLVSILVGDPTSLSGAPDTYRTELW